MNISELKDAITIVEVLEHYGWVDDLGWNTGWGAWQKTLCPFHDDHEPSASVNTDEGYFRCYVCTPGDRAQDIVDMVVDQEGITTREAIAWLTENFLEG